MYVFSLQLLTPTKIQYSVLRDGKFKFLHTNNSGQLMHGGGGLFFGSWMIQGSLRE
jgi:hypothetical protein